MCNPVRSKPFAGEKADRNAPTSNAGKKLYGPPHKAVIRKNAYISRRCSRLLSQRALLTAALIATLSFALPSVVGQSYNQSPADPNQSTFTLRVATDIVLTNVVVRDKSGALVRDLKQTDFTILEDNKPQTIRSFDFQSVDQAAALQNQQLAALGNETGTISGRVADLLNNNFASNTAALHDHRLIVLFFDLSSMQPEDIDRAVDAAKSYINQQMAPADLVASVSFSTSLRLDQDFTADKTALLRTLSRYNGTDSSGFTPGGTTGATDGTADDASSFAADDTEYNNLNTDRELFAIEQIARSLERVDQRKSLLYFSGGLSRNGIENQASLRTATNAAVRANMALYTVDSRGLEALPPVGNASQGSLRGISAYSGGAVQSQLDSNFASQELLGTLASDTGGKFFSDSNDFAPAFQEVQRDTEAYYILGFRSTNLSRDGRFRHLTIRVNRPGLKLSYRPGYYAAADFQHQRTEDREQTLLDQMRSDSPATDVALYLQALYFRVDPKRFFVPVSLVVPGSQIPFTSKSNQDRATIDILGEVKDAQGIIVGNVRDTVKLALDAAQQVQRKNIQYSTGFTLASGRYHLKFVVRENQTGNMGSFETDLQVPDFSKSPLKLSSVALAGQRAPNITKHPTNPLVRDGFELIPNIAHVFRTDGHLYLLYEVYDPAREKVSGAPAAATGLARRPEGAVHVLTSVEFLLNGNKVFETPLVETDTVNVPERGAVSFQFDLPLHALPPGTYLCQVNVVDDAGGAFSFPREAIQIRAAAASSPPSQQPAGSPAVTPPGR